MAPRPLRRGTSGCPTRRSNPTRTQPGSCGRLWLATSSSPLYSFSGRRTATLPCFIQYNVQTRRTHAVIPSQADLLIAPAPRLAGTSHASFDTACIPPRHRSALGVRRRSSPGSHMRLRSSTGNWSCPGRPNDSRRRCSGAGGTRCIRNDCQYPTRCPAGLPPAGNLRWFRCKDHRYTTVRPYLLLSYHRA